MGQKIVAIQVLVNTEEKTGLIFKWPSSLALYKSPINILKGKRPTQFYLEGSSRDKGYVEANNSHTEDNANIDFLAESFVSLEMYTPKKKKCGLQYKRTKDRER